MQSLCHAAGTVLCLRTWGTRRQFRALLKCLTAVLCLIGSGHSQSNPGTYEVLHAFNLTDGAFPEAGLLRDTAGNLYGTAGAGGDSAATCTFPYCGVVFKIDPSGNETILHSFGGNVDGAIPLAGLIEDAAGNLYGTTRSGGPLGAGTVFKIDPAGNFTILHAFGGSPDGGSPWSGLVLDSDGNLYGTTRGGGAISPAGGTIFKIDPNGHESVLYSFSGGADGRLPNELIRDSAGNLFGTTFGGGLQTCTNINDANGQSCGVVFKLDPNGVFNVLYSFHSDQQGDGARSLARLLLDAQGNLYGTTEYGGQPACSVDIPGTVPPLVVPIGCGTIFKLDPTGTYTRLHTFSTLIDGWFPLAGLVADESGNLYGTTEASVFEMDVSGNLTVLYDFTWGADGGGSHAPLLRDSAGNLYGTAPVGGNLNCSFGGGCGTVFKLPATTSPVFNVSVAFTAGGTGTVTSTPSGINCTTDCASAFPAGTTVTLTATPTAGSTFGGWSGGGLSSSCNNNTCTMNSAQAWAVTFNPPQPDFGVSASVFTPAAVNPGSPASATISTAGVAGFSGSIALSCTVQSAVPFAPTCSISPASVNVGTSATLTVKTTGPTASSISPSDSGLSWAAGLPVLAFLAGGAGFIGPSSTRKIRFQLACFVMAIAFFQIACGGSSNTSGGTPAGTYTIVVTGTSGSLQHSVNPNLTLTVQ